MRTKESKAVEHKQSQYGTIVGLWGHRVAGASKSLPKRQNKECSSPVLMVWGAPPRAASAKTQSSQEGSGL